MRARIPEIKRGREWAAADPGREGVVFSSGVSRHFLMFREERSKGDGNLSQG